MESASLTETGVNPQDTKTKANGQDAGQSHEENQYLDLIHQILAHGEHRPDRLKIILQLRGSYIKLI